MRPKNRKFFVLTLLGSLGLGPLWATAQTITPDPTSPFTFVTWGDTRGTTPGSVDTAVLSSLSSQVPSLYPSFTMFVGDCCGSFDNKCTSNTSTGWKYAINDGAPGNGVFNITFPFRGDHDGNAKRWDTFFSGVDGEIATAGGTNFNFYAKDGPERTYSFDFVNAHFVGIDMPRGDISTMTAGQISWLDSDITAAEGRGLTHTFIFDHGPIYYVDGHPSTPSASLIAVMNKHVSISATFHGHEHVLAYAHVDSTHVPGVTHPWEEFISGGGGAPLYTCDATRLLDTGAYPDSCEGSSYGFMTVDVSGNTFTVNEHFQGGSIANTWTFTKP